MYLSEIVRLESIDFLGVARVVICFALFALVASESVCVVPNRRRQLECNEWRVCRIV